MKGSRLIQKTTYLVLVSSALSIKSCITKQTKKNNTGDPRHFAHPVPSHVIPFPPRQIHSKYIIFNDLFELNYLHVEISSVRLFHSITGVEKLPIRGPAPQSRP